MSDLKFNQRLVEIVSEALETEVSMNSDVETVPQWDSLGKLSILTALDQATNGKAGAIANLVRCNSMTDLAECLKSNGISQIS